MNTMLKTRNGGTKAPGGLYWHFGNWEIKALDGKEVTLPGSAEERYVRIPTVALLVLGPVMGLAFAMFLPFIGFALFAHAAVKKVTGGVKRGATELASTVQPGGFAAGSAYFTGKPGEEKDGAAPGEAKGGELERLEKEIAARKEQE